MRALFFVAGVVCWATCSAQYRPLSISLAQAQSTASAGVALDEEGCRNFNPKSPNDYYVDCERHATTCNCPAGKFGVNVTKISGRWTGICLPCPAGFWSMDGVHCSKVSCPEFSIGHPFCQCKAGTVAMVNGVASPLLWSGCTGKWVGSCLSTYKPFPGKNVTITSIFDGPEGIINYSSVHFFFQSNRDPHATYKCTLDGQTKECFQPSVNYESLPQGEHVFSVEATDARGKVDLNPPSQNFYVNVGCPEHSYAAGFPTWSCVCNGGYYARNKEHIVFDEGHYKGTCKKCDSCPAGSERTRCGFIEEGFCQECQEGKYKASGKIGSSEDMCEECRACNKGRHNIGCNSRSKGTCYDCPAGTYQDQPKENGYGSQCKPCDKCPGGFGNSECTWSTEQNKGSECVACEPGYYKAVSISELRQNSTGTTAGYGATIVNGTLVSWAPCQQCEGCPAGYVREGCNATSPGSCVACPEDHFKLEGVEAGPDTQCTACSPCNRAEGGYRAHCGGPAGPGECLVCEECAGSWNDICYCNDYEPEDSNSTNFIVL